MALLALLVATGAWVRFSDQLAGWMPGLAAPVHEAGTSPVAGLVELGMAPSAQGAAAVQAMGLPSPDAAALADAVQRRRVRLVQLPLFERDGGSGAAVQVSASGLSRIVRLGATPTVLTLPIAHVGSVTFRLVGAASPVDLGAITLSGPVALPSLAPGQLLQVGVVAQ